MPGGDCTHMNRPWIASYPPGVPSTIDLEQYASVVEVFERSVRQFHARPAYESLGARMTYGKLDACSCEFAGYLQSLGLVAGERVAVMMPNLLQYPVAVFGILRAGMTVVNVNPQYTPRELQHQLCDADASTIVIVDAFAHTLQQCIAQTPVRNVVVTSVGDLLGFPRSVLVNLVVRYVRKLVKAFSLPGAVRFTDALAVGARAGFTRVERAHDDIAFLQYTGGTTGVAKGAMLTHGNLVANVLQAAAFLAPMLEDEGEVVFTALPLYHIFALTANCLTFMHFGALNHMVLNPRDLPALVKELASARPSCITGVNTLYNALLNAPGIDSVDFSRMKVALGGGMSVQRVVSERWKALTGVPLLEAYGLTETAPAVCINPLDQQDFTGSIGVPVPGTDVCLLDDQGNPAATGEAGELCVRGPQVMAGYWRRPLETEQVMQDGWLRTGDIARMDERGYFYIVDRKKDLIIVSGFNVYPNEVEEVVAALPGVREVAVIGSPSERSGEVVKVFVVRNDPSLDEQGVIEWCRQRLTAYKVPRVVVFREQLPKSNVGKILRRALREEEHARIDHTAEPKPGARH